MMSMAGLGPGTEILFKDLPPTSYGTDCLYARLVNFPNTKCINLGLGPNWVPFLHHADLLAKVPFRYDKYFYGGIKRPTGIESTEMAAILSSASVAVITGGTIVYECLAIGVPCVVFPQETNLIKEADWFAQKQCISNIGYDHGMDMAILDKMVVTMFHDQELAVRQSNNGRTMIDGLGMHRATTAIDALLATIPNSQG